MAYLSSKDIVEMTNEQIADWINVHLKNDGPPMFLTNPTIEQLAAWENYKHDLDTHEQMIRELQRRGATVDEDGRLAR